MKRLYMVLHEGSIATLEREVSRYLDFGAVPAGGLVRDGHYWCQAIYVPDTNSPILGKVQEGNDWEARVKELIAERKILEAVKYVKQALNIDLGEAKDIVDRMI